MATEVCRDCQDGCVECSNASFCLSCQTSMYLVEGVCIAVCPSETFPSGTSCLLCEAGCSKCTSANTCLMCTYSFSLYLGDCLSDCPSNMASFNHSCIACSILFSNCLQCNSIQCSKCQADFYLHTPANSPSSCLSSCPDGYVQDVSPNSIQVCTMCSTNCIQCSFKSANCTLCKSGYSLH